MSDSKRYSLSRKIHTHARERKLGRKPEATYVRDGEGGLGRRRKTTGMDGLYYGDGNL